jgi:hypothetical protein
MKKGPSNEDICQMELSQLDEQEEFEKISGELEPVSSPLLHVPFFYLHISGFSNKEQRRN